MLVTQPQSQTVNRGSGISFTATANGTPTLTYQWQKDGVDIPGATSPSLSVANVQSSDAGSYTVTVSNAVGSVTSDPAMLTVNAVSQLITFNALPDIGFTTTPFALSAAASSGLPVTFDVLSGPASVNGTFLTLTGAGVVTIRALQSGNATYAAAVPVDRTFTVTKAAALVTLGSLTTTYDGTAKSATATTNPAGLAITFTYNGSATAPATAGSYSVMGTVNEANYQGSASDTLVIAKAVATVTLGSLTRTYDGVAKPVTAVTNPLGLTVDFTYDGSATVPTNAGSYAVAGTINSANYTGTASGALVIAKADQAIAFTGPTNQPYSAVPIALNATAASGLTVAFEVISGPATVSGATLTLIGAGPITIRASQVGDANRNAAVPVDHSFVVAANFAVWKLAKFTMTELLDATVSGPNADPDHDSLVNLLEYALGLEPKSPNTADLPAVTVEGSDWVYTVTRPAGITDVIYTFEYSTDLVDWSTVTAQFVATSGGMEIWRAMSPVISAPNCYFRLKISQ